MRYSIIVAVTLCLFAKNATAQMSGASYKDRLFEKFFATKTYFVGTGDSIFDEAVKEAMKTEWKVTPCEFMSKSDFESNKGNKEYSFVKSINFFERITTQKGTIFEYTYRFYALLMGGQLDNSWSDLLAYCPLNERNEKYNFPVKRIGILIHNLNATVMLVKEKSMRGNYWKVGKRLQAVYAERAGTLKNKTLLVDTSLVPFDINEFKSNYAGKVEFASRDKVNQAIKEKNKEYCLFQPAITVHKNVLVFDLETYDCIYYDSEKYSGKLNMKDVKRLNKAVNR